MRIFIQGVIVAAKKKTAAKKIAKKAPVKRTVKKSAVKKAAVKKAPVRKTVAKNKVAKKVTAKRAVKKSVVKKSAVKKAAVKKTTAKKVAPRKIAKKTATKTVSTPTAVISSPVVPVVPVVSKPVALAPKPVALPKQKTSGRVVFLVVIGIILLAMIVWSKSGKEGDDVPKPTPSMSQSDQPTETATAQPTESAAAVAAVESPSKFVALKSAVGLTLRWIAPNAIDGLTGYNVEIRANGKGDWIVIATLPVDQLTQSVSKNSNSGWTQFRVSSIYRDGQVASATAFGIPGEFK